jgi:SnoaL-like domain
MCKRFYILMISISIYSCSETSVKTTPQDLIKKYELLVLEMKADSIAQLFTTDAEIGHEDQSPVRGRDSIYAFLSSFKTVRVINNHDEILSSAVKNDSAILNGSYAQTVIASGKDTVNVAGKFTATMVRDKDSWLISKMKTRSN